ncbi:MAG: class I SAM-dependent methyltransferase [Bacteriovoracia bacterium]
MPVKYELETVNCLSCDSSSYEFYLRAKDLISHTGEAFTVVKCKVCGLKWTNPRVKAEHIGQFYPESYGPYAIGKARITFGDVSRRISSHIIVSGFHVPKDNYHGKKILEIGCSSGAFLKKLQDLGAETQGIEFSEFAAHQAQEKGLKVHVGTLDDFRSADTFDYVFGWMVLEHLYDPKKDLSSIRKRLKPKGIFAFSVPNINSLDFFLFRKYWYALQVPTHITHFDKKSIKKMLQDQGFRVILLVDHVSATNYIFSLKNYLNENGIRLFDRFIHAFVYKKWFMPLRKSIDLLIRLTHQSGRMTVWAQKNDQGDL